MNDKYALMFAKIEEADQRFYEARHGLELEPAEMHEQLNLRKLELFTELKQQGLRDVLEIDHNTLANIAHFLFVHREALAEFPDLVLFWLDTLQTVATFIKNGAAETDIARYSQVVQAEVEPPVDILRQNALDAANLLIAESIRQGEDDTREYDRCSFLAKTARNLYAALGLDPEAEQERVKREIEEADE